MILTSLKLRVSLFWKITSLERRNKENLLLPIFLFHTIFRPLIWTELKTAQSKYRHPGRLYTYLQCQTNFAVVLFLCKFSKLPSIHTPLYAEGMTVMHYTSPGKLFAVRPSNRRKEPHPAPFEYLLHLA